MSEITATVCIRGSRRDMLPDALRSVLDQGREDIEVIVGDEFGTLADVVGRFDDPRIRYRRFEKRPGRTGHARALLNEARGRYLNLMDDDDRWLPGFLDSTIECLNAHPDVGIVFTNYFNDAGGRLCERRWSLPGGRHDRFLTTFIRGCPIGLSFALVRRAVWEEGETLHALRDDALVDGTLWMRAADAGWPFYFIDSRLGVWRWHPGQSIHEGELFCERAMRMWASFRFADPEAERLRSLRLAEAHLERANLRLRGRLFRAALDDVRAACASSPNWLGERGLVALFGLRRGAARLLARHPRLVQPAFSTWRLLERFDRFG